MFGFCSRQPKAPERVSTDTVIPVGFYDGTILYRNLVMYTLFVFDDVLDHQRLRTCLERVVSRPGWNKLGARLRRNKNGQLEHHIPASFSKGRPPIGYQHLDLSDVAMEDHAIASQIPRAPRDGPPVIVGDPEQFADLYSGPGIPKSIDDFLYTDRPQLGLRVVSFKNKTIVVMYWIHLAFDAIAKRSILEAWMLMLQGREDEILEPLPPDKYILENIGKNPPEPHVLAKHHMSTLSLVPWVLRNAYALTIAPKDNRMLCVPAAYFTKLKEKALADLTKQAAAAGDTEKPFISEGDVLMAWVARQCMGTSSKNPETMVNVQQVYQWRPALADLIPDGRPVLHNCIGFITTMVSVKDICQKPLSYLASQIRETIKTQGSREQVEAHASLILKDPIARGLPVFGKSSMQLFLFSNWQKANMYSVDLSAAAVKPRNTPLVPSYVQSTREPYTFNESFFYVGKDPEGNHWIVGYRMRGHWDKMAKELAAEEI